MADLLVSAVRRVGLVTAIDQVRELCFQDGQLTLSRLRIVQLHREQRLHVGARDGTLLAQIEDAGADSGSLWVAESLAAKTARSNVRILNAVAIQGPDLAR